MWEVLNCLKQFDFQFEASSARFSLHDARLNEKMKPLAIRRFVGYRLYRALAKFNAAHRSNADAVASPNAAECAAANFFGDLQSARCRERAKRCLTSKSARLSSHASF